MLQFINTERTIRLEQEIGTRSYTPKIKPSIVNLQCVVYSLRVICAMQIMSGTQPDTFINALLSTKIRQSVDIS